MVQDLNNLVLSISTLPRLPFTMSHEHIALVCGLRHALDQLLHKIASNPFHLSSLTSEEQAVVSTVSRLVSQRTAGAGTAKWNPARSSLPGPSHSSPHSRGSYSGNDDLAGFHLAVPAPAVLWDTNLLTVETTACSSLVSEERWKGLLAILCSSWSRACLSPHTRAMCSWDIVKGNLGRVEIDNTRLFKSCTIHRF